MFDKTFCVHESFVTENLFKDSKYMLFLLLCLKANQK